MRWWTIGAIGLGAWWFFRKPSAPKTSASVKTSRGSASVSTNSHGTTVNVQVPTIGKKQTGDVLINPVNYTFDEIFEMASVSPSNEFKTWAAQLLQDNGRLEQVSILRGQIAASEGAK